MKFEVASASAKGGDPTLPLLTPGNILSHVIGARRDLRPAAEYSADLAVSEPTSIAASYKFGHLIVLPHPTNSDT